MTLQANAPLAPTSAPTSAPTAPSRRARREQRRRLARQDVLAARLAELARIDVLLSDAASVVGQGWIQHAWFRYLDDAGQAQLATALDVGRTAGRPVMGACLVGGLVQAGGGPAAASSQLVSRALELTWHTLHEPTGRAVHWSPSPAVHLAHVRDLTRWNDARGRTPSEVTALLDATSTAGLVEVARTRAEQAVL